jgi:polysaccharide biosynthesis/export protein
LVIGLDDSFTFACLSMLGCKLFLPTYLVVDDAVLIAVVAPMRIFSAPSRWPLTIGLSLGYCAIAGSAALAQTQLPPFTGASTLPPLKPATAAGAASEPIPLSTRIPFSQRRQPVDPVNYYIGPGDEVAITVVGYPEYTGNRSVLSDGTISLPLIGDVLAADRTPTQLSSELTRRLNEVLVNPAVTINVSSQRPVTVNIGGAVQRPGPVQLRNLRSTGELSQSSNVAGVVSLQRPTVTAALLEAGGITREADLAQVQLRRYTPDRNLPPVILNLWDAIGGSQPGRDLTLQDGDTLYVPKLADPSSVDGQLMAQSSFAPRTVRVKVVGEVVRPGEVGVPPDGTISSAITIAGGPTTSARMKEVRFVRRLADGRIEEKKLDLNQLSDEIQIQDGDVVYVPKTAGDKGVDLANRVVNPIGLILRLFGIR